MKRQVLNVLAFVIPFAREEREAGFTLIEMMAVVALLGILGAPQINNFLIERAGGVAGVSVTQLNTIGTKAQEYCDDNQSDCTGVSIAQLVTAGYLGNTLIPPLGGTYTITVGTPTNTFIITDPNNYSAEKVYGMRITNAAGAALTAPSSGTATLQLEYQSAKGGVTTQT